jgi:hypothetical protein
MTLYTKSEAYPAALPFRLVLADGSTRTDPTTFSAQEIADAGYVEAPPQPSFDVSNQNLDWDGASWVVSSVPVEYVPLSRIDFFRLLTAAGGLTQANLVAARSDAALEAFWILLELTERVHRDAPEIGPALAGLEGLGYIEAGGAVAILAAWPAA